MLGRGKKNQACDRVKCADRSRKASTQPDQTAHPAGLAIATVGEKPFRIAVGAEVSAADPTHATTLQRAPSQLIKIGIPTGGVIGAGPEATLIVGVCRNKLLINFISHFEVHRPNGGP